ncbi:hypothetical protein L6452_34808 [Arctium lappa]|uniref:Uncharacterized protein n=1 Tax=Arctium lappa TaxID=4217 RepID=A0ACB8YKF7_ARCLA|nr:hypothetical protein L6452_34808 [Arctium lappa]
MKEDTLLKEIGGAGRGGASVVVDGDKEMANKKGCYNNPSYLVLCILSNTCLRHQSMGEGERSLEAAAISYFPYDILALIGTSGGAI